MRDGGGFRRGMNIGRKGVMFCDKSDERTQRVESMERVRDDIGRVRLERVIYGLKISLNFLERKQS